MFNLLNCQIEIHASFSIIAFFVFLDGNEMPWIWRCNDL